MIPELAAGGLKLVQWSHGGQNVATSPDKSLFLHDSLVIENATGSERVTIRDHEGPIRAVAASFDNSLIATGASDGRIRLWDSTSGEQVAILQGRPETLRLQRSYSAEVYSVEFSPDDQRLLSGGDDARVTLWDLETGKDVLSLQPHESYVHVVAFSPDGTRILSGSGDSTLRIWDSVPLFEREREIRAAAALRDEMQPRVKALMEELQDAALVAAKLRADEALDPARRRAALRVLLALATAPR
jgi:WD40 repeat protein